MYTFGAPCYHHFDWDEMVAIDEEVEQEAAREDIRQKDYCYKCKTDKLYWHAMTAKCSKCHSIILGGNDAEKKKSNT